jgi:fused signal recognition particle receptor
MIRLGEQHRSGRPILFKLFRRNKEASPVEEAEPQAEGAEALEAAAPAATSVAVAAPEPPLVEQPGPAVVWQEEVELTGDLDEEPELAEAWPEAEGEELPEEFVEKTDQAVERTRRSWFKRLVGVFERSQIDGELWEELEEILIGADVGLETTEKVLDSVRERVRREGMKLPVEAREALKDELLAILAIGDEKGRLWGSGASDGATASPAVILVVGVNGVGKTTSIAKLAAAFKRDGERVILAAGDTFRAAAIDQLKVWGQRVGVEVIANRPDSDPSSVVFDALEAARARRADVVIVDTAGRLHTKFNLMQELGKIRKVTQAKDPTAPHEVVLVIDAITGQNGLMQARAFAESVEVTGIILSKLDSTAKGGIVFAIADQLGIPVRFIGTGERATDIAPFDAREYVERLFA